ncbi:MAG TPA: DoxX-like family protein [Candidatus Acidoferrum sp.]|nr:DoxX-like family protein [Candidatus Acidoferrum sp.]
MHGFALAFPPLIILRSAVAAVWLYEGLWCKVLGRAKLEAQVVAAVPAIGPRFGQLLLKALGVIEIALAAWVLWGIQPGACAIGETSLLVILNANGLLWARHIIHDPAGMIIKNAAFLVLVWVCGATPGVLL